MASVNNQKVDVVATRESFNFFTTYKLKHFTKTLSNKSVPPLYLPFRPPCTETY